MKPYIYILIFTYWCSIQAFCQEVILSPDNNPALKKYIKNESSEMDWFIYKDTVKFQIGKILTTLETKDDAIYIVTSVQMNNSPSTWIDSTVITTSLEPIYHSSYNQQRDMVLNFGKKVTGYYLDKQTGENVIIAEETKRSYFDSNFYPHLIRWLPLKEGYEAVISIFDFNPKAKKGVITATIKSVKKTYLTWKGEDRNVWQVETSDDISDNTVLVTYFIDSSSRELLKQTIDANGRKMSMELKNY